MSVSARRTKRRITLKRRSAQRQHFVLFLWQDGAVLLKPSKEYLTDFANDVLAQGEIGYTERFRYIGSSHV